MKATLAGAADHSAIPELSLTGDRENRKANVILDINAVEPRGWRRLLGGSHLLARLHFTGTKELVQPGGGGEHRADIAVHQASFSGNLETQSHRLEARHHGDPGPAP